MATVNVVNVSPEQERAKLANLETAAAEEESNAPIQASCEPGPTDSGGDRVCVPPSLTASFVRVSLNDPELLRHRDTLVTGLESLVRTYCNIDSSGAEVTESLKEPREPPTLQPPPESNIDVELSERDQYEYFASDGSESTVGTPQLDNKSEDNASSSSSVVTDTPVPLVSSHYTLRSSKLVQIIHNGKDIKLKSKEMKLRGKHNPTLHFKVMSHASSPESSSNKYIMLHTDIDVPQNYNRILDTAKFTISATLIDRSASNTPPPLPQPQSQSFTLYQEDKHMVFQLFPHSFILNSTRSSINLVIEVQLLYYTPPEEKVPDYEENNPSDSVGYVDIQRRTDSPADVSLVSAEWTVSVTNKEEIIEWKEQGLTLHVPKNSLPEGCVHTNVTMVIDHRNQAQNSHSRCVLYGLKCIDGEQPEMTLTTHRSAVDTPQSQRSELPTIHENPHSGSTDMDSNVPKDHQST